MTDAGTLEVTETISHLDEPWQCYQETCSIPATWQILVKPCECVILACPGHKILAQVSMERYARENSAFGCRMCYSVVNPSRVKFIPM